MTFAQRQFISVFLNNPKFGETVYYNSIEIKAVIYRDGLLQSGQRFDGAANSQQSKYKVHITISNDTDEGVPTIQKRIDTVRLQTVFGSDFESYHVAEVIKGDAGSWTLGLTK